MVRNVTSVRRVTAVLPGFGISCWVWVWLVCFTLAFLMLAPSNYNNWGLLFPLAVLAQSMGDSVDRLRSWPSAAIVPGFSVSVFASCIATLAGVALFGALLAWLRDAVPAIGPGLMIGIGTVVLSILLGVRVGRVILVIVTSGAVWDFWSGPDASLGAMLSEPLIQFVTSAVAVIAVVALLRLHQLPPTAGKLTVGALWESGGTTRTMVVSGLWLAGFVLCRMLEPLSGLLHYLGVLYFLGAFGQVVDGLLDMHTRLLWNWLPATTRSRDQLGRRCAAGLALRSVAWLPAGAMAATLQAWVAPQEPSYELLLLVHIAFLLLIALLAHVAYRWPPAPLLLLLTGIPAYLFLVLVFALLSLIEYTPLGYTLLVAGLFASAWLAVFVGGRGLAKAEFVA